MCAAQCRNQAATTQQEAQPTDSFTQCGILKICVLTCWRSRARALCWRLPYLPLLSSSSTFRLTTIPTLSFGRLCLLLVPIKPPGLSSAAMADKVEVYLERYSDGVRYEGFTAPPGTPGYTGDANEKYIEATTDGRFRIVVKLRRGFDFMGSPRVRVNYYVDQGTPTVHTLSKNRSQSASPSDRSHRERSLGVIRKFINGQYMNCGLTFGELKSGSYLPTTY